MDKNIVLNDAIKQINTLKLQYKQSKLNLEKQQKEYLKIKQSYDKTNDKKVKKQLYQFLLKTKKSFELSKSEIKKIHELYFVMNSIVKELKKNSQVQNNENEKVALENEKSILENERVALENEKSILENERVALENEKSILENERVALGNEKSILENERVAFENEKLILEDERVSFKSEESTSENNTNIQSNELDENQNKPKKSFIKKILTYIAFFLIGGLFIFLDDQETEFEKNIKLWFNEKVEIIRQLSNDNITNTQQIFNESESNLMYVFQMESYQVIMTILLITIIIGIFKGFGENRKIIVFADYNDLGLTFLVPASFALISIIGMNFGLVWETTLLIAFIVSFLIALKVIIDTYNYNERALGKTLLSLITKFPLAIIWILNLITLLNPGGKTAAQRRANRGTALVILTLLTPIVGGLVVNKSGSFFNPMSWLKGKRIGSVRNHL